MARASDVQGCSDASSGGQQSSQGGHLSWFLGPRLGTSLKGRVQKPPSTLGRAVIGRRSWQGCRPQGSRVQPEPRL